MAHRLLGLLVPILWLRTLIGILVMPLLVDTALAQGVRDLARTPAAKPTTDASNGTQTGNGTADAHATDGDGSGDSDGTGLLIDTFATEAPTPTNGSEPTEGEVDEEDQWLNRAERRAQQRHDAQAKRPRR